MKIQNFIFVLFCIISTTVLGQTISPDNRIIVLGEATIEIPADKIVFAITLQYDDSTNIQNAYKLHKESENKLVNFLKELNIPNKNISYSLINIGKQMNINYETNQRKTSFGTNQIVSVTIDDVNKYADFMMKLILAGFTEVNTSFTSSKENDFHELLIEKAIDAARKKATSMAKFSKRTISKILKVSDTEESDSLFGYYNDNSALAASISGESSITEIPQTISKNLKLKVVFELK